MSFLTFGVSDNLNVRCAVYVQYLLQNVVTLARKSYREVWNISIQVLIKRIAFYTFASGVMLIY
ncbi:MULTISPECIES: hypothetical protein [unclassified Wolbachia]|uniref:hypothetical protein n=1 Tax=unclassified Wolbachia TaxID=2640676 RepID=UPI00221EB0C9|nr:MULTISPECIES: hypothetical protein [unclassified Wolbachia]